MFHENRLRTREPLRFSFINWNKIPLNHREASQQFRRKVEINIEKQRYRVKTIDSGAELEEVLKLRYDIFHREFMGKVFPFGVDWENLDLASDHLVIVDKKSEKIVGTYRLLSSAFTTLFYSQSEFDISALIKKSNNLLELSRAGVHKQYRTGAVMNLLWRGVSEYIQKIGAEYVFGCASIKTMSSIRVAFIIDELKMRGALLDGLPIFPTKKYTMPMKTPNFLEVFLDSRGAKVGTPLLPSLFESYLHAGAKVIPIPALDREFRCVDFLTVLDVKSLKEQYKRRYRTHAQ